MAIKMRHRALPASKGCAVSHAGVPNRTLLLLAFGKAGLLVRACNPSSSESGTGSGASQPIGIAAHLSDHAHVSHVWCDVIAHDAHVSHGVHRENEARTGASIARSRSSYRKRGRSGLCNTMGQMHIEICHGTNYRGPFERIVHAERLSLHFAVHANE